MLQPASQPQWAGLIRNAAAETLPCPWRRDFIWPLGSSGTGLAALPVGQTSRRTGGRLILANRTSCGRIESRYVVGAPTRYIPLFRSRGGRRSAAAPEISLFVALINIIQPDCGAEP